MRQIEHIGNHELCLRPGGASALFRSFYCQRCQVDTGYLKALSGQPDTIHSRSTAYFERATRLNCVPTQNTLQLRGRPTRVPRQIPALVAIVPINGLCHGLYAAMLRDSINWEGTGAVDTYRYERRDPIIHHSFARARALIHAPETAADTT